MSALLPLSRPEALDALLGDVPAGMFGARFHELCERLDRYIRALTCELAATLGLGPGPVPDVGELIATRGWSTDDRPTISWLFESLALFGRAHRNADGWVVENLDGGGLAAGIRAEAVADEPRTAPAYEVLELSAAAVPSVLGGEKRGEEALFSPSTLGLWFEYFSNENPHYAPNNALTAAAIGSAVGPDARLLELGGGGGSAAEAVLQELTQRGVTPARFVFTELHPAFLRRGTRHVQSILPEGCEFEARRFDVDGDPAQAGLEDGSFDAVFAVNVLHLARDPAATLTRLKRLLAPGGAVVLGELIRPASGAVHLELPFTLLEAFRKAPLVEGIRYREGFMTLDGWRRALDAAGFGEVEVLPAHLERCHELYAGFYCAVLTAREKAAG